MSSHGHSGEGLTRPPLNALTSNQSNCNARRVKLTRQALAAFGGVRVPRLVGIAERALRLEISLKKPHRIGERSGANRLIESHRIPRRFSYACTQDARLERLCL